MEESKLEREERTSSLACKLRATKLNFSRSNIEPCPRQQIQGKSCRERSLIIEHINQAAVINAVIALLRLTEFTQPRRSTSGSFWTNIEHTPTKTAIEINGRRARTFDYEIWTSSFFCRTPSVLCYRLLPELSTMWLIRLAG